MEKRIVPAFLFCAEFPEGKSFKTEPEFYAALRDGWVESPKDIVLACPVPSAPVSQAREEIVSPAPDLAPSVPVVEEQKPPEVPFKRGPGRPRKVRDDGT